MRQLVVNMQNLDASPLQLQSEACVLVAIFMELFVETDGEKQFALDKEIEGGELGIGKTAAMFKRQSLLNCYLIVVAQTSRWPWALG